MNLSELVDGFRKLNTGKTGFLVMCHLLEEGPSPMRELALFAGVSTAAITGAVDSLEKKGWVSRKPHKKDRRVLVIFLTDSGVAELKFLERAKLIEA